MTPYEWKMFHWDVKQTNKNNDNQSINVLELIVLLKIRGPQALLVT